MQNVLNVYKPKGMTPLEVIEKLRITYPELKDKKISYAGRLDPLAHGVLLLVIGEETKQKEKYLALPKTYEFEMIFGLETDTYDILGYLKSIETKQIPRNVNLFVNRFVNSLLGTHLQPYPPYSSKAVNGKPLFWWAKNNKLNELTIPKHRIEIFDFNVLSMDVMVTEKFEKEIKSEIALITGDFRQKIILDRWQKFFSQKDIKKQLPTAKFRISCSSGTYVRGLAQQLGKELGCGGVAIDILRTGVGEYVLKDAMPLKF